MLESLQDRTEASYLLAELAKSILEEESDVLANKNRHDAADDEPILTRDYFSVISRMSFVPMISRISRRFTCNACC